MVGITGIKISHPDLSDQVFKDIKHFEFNETGPIESQSVDKSILTTWSASGTIKLHKWQRRGLQRFIKSFPKPRLPRKYKKRLKLYYKVDNKSFYSVFTTKLLLTIIANKQLKNSDKRPN